MDRRCLLQAIALGYAALRTGKSLAQDVVPADIIDPSVASRIQFKAKNFDQDFRDDFYVVGEEKNILLAVVAKLALVKKIVGFGHFNLISFDELLKRAANSELGAFTAQEMAFMEGLFSREAKEYGFFGSKVSTELTSRINPSHAIKMPGTGHFLFRGKPEALYAEVKKDVGHDIVLTSGIRSVVKQLDLFLNKSLQCGGNHSRASRSLAPPGYSFHGAGTLMSVK